MSLPAHFVLALALGTRRRARSLFYERIRRVAGEDVPHDLAGGVPW